MSQYVYVTGQILFQVNFDLTKVDSQFPLFPSPNAFALGGHVTAFL